MPKKRKFGATFIDDLESGKNIDKRTTAKDLQDALRPKKRGSQTPFSKALSQQKNR